jgi:predicted amidohydrolase YtcJ
MLRRAALAAALASLVVPVVAGRDKKDKELPPRADRIFLKGHIWTGDPEGPADATAIAVRGPRVLAIGSDLEIARHSGVGTLATDLKGHWVFPGFNDAHLHFLVLDSLDLAGIDSLDVLKKTIADYASAHPEKAWIEGRGWSAATFPGGAPDRRLLDALVPERPAFLGDRDGHTGWCNSRALALAGIARATPNPPYGIVVRDATGEPTGLLKEAARDLVEILIPPPNPEERYQALKRGLDRAASYGLTSVQNASFNRENLRTYERVLDEGGMKVRFLFALPFVKDLPEEELARYNQLREKYTGPLVKFAAVKGMLDGVVDMKTAAMFEPYVGGENGAPHWSQADLDRTAAFYDANGFQILLHAIGDRAIHMALNAYEFVARTNPERERRHRVEHVEVPQLSDIPRFKQLGVIASTQALFANPDKTTLLNYAKLLGPERASRANAFKLFDDAGVVQAFGSDYPVFSMEVLKGIYCAATRMTPEGTPAGGWYPENRISVEAALRHFTRDAAFASFDEMEKGTLSVGRLADFVVLSENILEPPPERLLHTKVLLTVLGGQDTYRAPEFEGDPAP